MLQDAPARCALLVPLAEGAATELAPGMYQLSFSMDRGRFATTEPADDVNRYRSEAALTFSM